MNIHESAEDYLEKILMLQEQKGSVRSDRYCGGDGLFQAERQCRHEKPA